jgi:hypothetical protein
MPDYQRGSNFRCVKISLLIIQIIEIVFLSVFLVLAVIALGATDSSKENQDHSEYLSVDSFLKKLFISKI